MITDQKTRQSFYYRSSEVSNNKRNSVYRENIPNSNAWQIDNRETNTNQTYMWIKDHKKP